MMNRDPESEDGGPRMPGMKMNGDMEMNSSNKTETDTATVPDVFIQQLDKLVNVYLQVKNALPRDDLQGAELHVNALKEALSAVDMNSIKDDHQMEVWMTHLAALKKHIEALEQTEGLEEFRKQFALLSTALTETLTTFGVERPLYVQFCPMARSGKGATWLSAQKKIANPYLGQKMPGCGETKKIIEPKK